MIVKPRPVETGIASSDVSDLLEYLVSTLPKWRARGKCRGTDPTVFFDGSREAKWICRGCPVKPECLDYAMSDPSLRGVWGGTTDRERGRIRG